MKRLLSAVVVLFVTAAAWAVPPTLELFDTVTLELMPPKGESNCLYYKRGDLRAGTVTNKNQMKQQLSLVLEICPTDSEASDALPGNYEEQKEIYLRNSTREKDPASCVSKFCSGDVLYNDDTRVLSRLIHFFDISHPEEGEAWRVYINKFLPDMELRLIIQGRYPTGAYCWMQDFYGDSEESGLWKEWVDAMGDFDPQILAE